ncbi:MAG: CvpA family protein [Cytophagaceae bacterium]|jgi:membrane protein required for colicin V production|nr:CvpA family protein [Cytophagaceae bacterium]
MVLDIILLAVLGFAGFRGYKDGIIMEVFSFLAVFLGLLAAVRLLHPAMEIMAPHARNAGPMLPFLTFAVVFAVVFALIFILGKVVKKSMGLTVMGNVDQFAGGLLGILKAGFLLGILFWIGELINITKVFPSLNDSYMASITSDFASGTVQFINHAFPIKEIFEKIKHILHGTKNGGF